LMPMLVEDIRSTQSDTLNQRLESNHHA